MRRSGFLLLLAGSALAVSAWSCLAEPAPDMPPPLQLVFFHPFRPGVLSQCQHALDLSAEVNWKPIDTSWRLGAALSLHWQGGTYTQDGPMPDSSDQDAHPHMDVCFALLAGGKPFMSGAVVREGSARLLNFPTLVRIRTQPGEPARFEWHPRYPAIR